VITETLRPVLYKCVKCGSYTEWDFNLGIEILCVNCWDKASEKYINELFAAGRRAYREANKDKIAAGHRAWYKANKDKVAAGHRAWYKANKDKAAAYA
jgi:hypothetical protein